MLKRPQYIVLLLVLVLVLVVLNLPPSTTARLKLAISGLFLPLFGLSSASQQALSQGAAAVMPRRDLVNENTRLRRDNEQLRLQSALTEEIRRENARLGQFLNGQKRVPWKLKLARVVARDPANWWRTVQIDLGRRDGVSNNLAVLTVDGLVGRVSSAGLTSSQVVLVGGADCQVSASVVETRDQGILAAGSGMPLDSSYVVLTYLANNSALKPGQTVVTSDLGGLFPKGIPVGTIADVRDVEFGLYKEAQVKLAARLGALEEVWVMFP